MTLSVYFHPFSSYCQKAKTALYEKGVPLETKLLDGNEPVAGEFAVDGPRPVAPSGRAQSEGSVFPKGEFRWQELQQFSSRERSSPACF